MAAAPIARKMRADITADGGLEIAVFDRLRNGESLTAIGKTYGVSRSLLWRHMRKEPARLAAYQQAMKDGAAGMVDKGREMLETVAEQPDPSSGKVQAVRNTADYLKWQAGVTDRKAFGSPEKNPHQFTVSIEHLHLAALQASGGPLDIPSLALPPENPIQANLDDMTSIVFPLPEAIDRMRSEATDSRGKPTDEAD